MNGRDRVGLGWRGELAAGILSSLDDIDVVEVILDDYLGASARRCSALRTLASQVPVIYHGVTLGLASTVPLVPSRVDALARLLGRLKTADWSEHLAFVRAGGFEIGHLAAPPRNPNTIEGACRNLEHLRRAIGALPALENIATLIEPSGSTLDEPTWAECVLRAVDAPLLLDLHNLYANAVNFGRDPFELLQAFPLARVRTVHLSGGRWLHPATATVAERAPRLLDDHLHDVPDVVYRLLAELASLTPNGLTVIIERDGHFPRFDVLLEQLRRARGALAAGRHATTSTPPAGRSHPCRRPGVTSAQFEALLARLYSDECYRARFLRDSAAVLAETTLSVEERAALMNIDRIGVELAATSYAAKRRRNRPPHPGRTSFGRTTE